MGKVTILTKDGLKAIMNMCDPDRTMEVEYGRKK